MPFRVLLADDHSVLRRGTRGLLEGDLFPGIQWICETATGEAVDCRVAG